MRPNWVKVRMKGNVEGLYTTEPDKNKDER